MKKGSDILVKGAVSLSCFAVAGLLCAGDVPIVTDVAMEQNSRKVTVTYSLTGAPGIVTLDFETNFVDAAGVTGWASIGGKNIGYVTGDAYRIVQPGEGRKAYWAAEKSWPGRRIVAPDRIRAVVRAVATNTPPDYMVCNLIDGTRFYYDTVEQLPGGIDSDDYRKHLFLMRKIPAKGRTFRMGTAASQPGYDSYFDTPHLVGFTHDYYMGVFEVTQWQWQRVMNVNPSAIKGDLLPAETFNPVENLFGNYNPEPISETEDNYEVGSSGFIAKMRTLTGLGTYLHAPTAAQWEFACRAGTVTQFNDGTDYTSDASVMNSTLTNIARYAANSIVVGAAGTATSNGAVRVGTLLPNAFGLYDMHGNVAEWCRDHRAWESMKSYSDPTRVYIDPAGPTNGAPDFIPTHYEKRGGGWSDTAEACQSGWRHGSNNCWVMNRTAIGARLCYTIVE